ncbi:hypothetical protein IST4116A_03065 [Burkholderia cenocepacia]|nr:hypothetical protein IST4134_02990 [Burkholderia cenocepacia]CAB5090917.1 hypothetical protein IST4110_03081 [Burkholderia cenocepacia]CAB5094568.1 hypothetical protein IST4131_03082 [Burkholderia cenocepacia]CAB5094640.1 hypothetical protein IST4116B_03079 [Burkholderia cenocepacia]CAB5099389.1 hypothetical protein IST4112_03084 [Burkholderia cenocepacia]
MLYGYSGVCLLFMAFCLFHMDNALGKFFFFLLVVCGWPAFLLIHKIRKVSADHSY